MKNIRAIIFDLDGLLVDSEPLHFQADKILYARYGKRPTLAIQKEFTGVKVIDQITELKKRWHLIPKVEDLLSKREEIFRQLVKTKLQLSSGALPLLQFLKEEKFLIGLGTSAEEWYLTTVFGKFRLGDYFVAIVNGDQVRYGKPHPETYLKVAKKLKVKPAVCLVLEDAIKGVTAAKKAGMLCFAIPGPYTQDADYSQADKVFPSLIEAKKFLMTSVTVK